MVSKNFSKDKKNKDALSDDLMEGIGGGANERFENVKTKRENVEYLDTKMDKIKLDIDNKKNFFGF